MGTTMMFIHDGAAGIHLVGTPSEYRGRGIARSIMQKILWDIKNKYGCRLCVLQSSPMGLSLYQKLGFQGVGEIRHWQYDKPLK